MAKDMEFPPLEDLGQNFGPEFFGMGDMMDPEMLKAHVVSALAGGGGILIVANIMERIEYFADKPKLKAGLTALLGIVGGRLMWSDDEAGRQHMAMGFTGGVSGIGLAKLVSSMFEEQGVRGALSAVEVANTPPYQYFSDTRGPVRQFFGMPNKGLAQPIVTDDDPMAFSGLEAVEVTADQLGEWMS
jgi:hypothetical protein